MATDPCLPETAPAAQASGSTGHHHVFHHVVGRIRHRVHHVHHAPIHHVPAPERVGEACGKHFAPDQPAVGTKAAAGNAKAAAGGAQAATSKAAAGGIMAGSAKTAISGLLAASALAGSLAASGLLGTSRHNAMPAPLQTTPSPTGPSVAGVSLPAELPGYTGPTKHAISPAAATPPDATTPPGSTTPGSATPPSSATAIPEPHSLALLLAALGIVLLARTLTRLRPAPLKRISPRR